MPTGKRDPSLLYLPIYKERKPSHVCLGILLAEPWTVLTLCGKEHRRIGCLQLLKHVNVPYLLLAGLRRPRVAQQLAGMEAQLVATEEALARERRRVEALEAELCCLRSQPAPECSQAGAAAPGPARCACLSSP